MKVTFAWRVIIAVNYDIVVMGQVAGSGNMA